MTEVIFNIETDYACELFQSCKQESFIAVAGISSSIAFLDFLGVNGQNTSMTITTFNLTEGVEYPQTLNGSAYPCDYAVHEDGILNKYSDIKNSTCSFCAAVCEAPAVSSKIGLFDGFNGSLVLYTYIGFIGFTVLFQLALYYAKQKNPVDDEEMRNLDETIEALQIKTAKINETDIGSLHTSGQTQ